MKMQIIAILPLMALCCSGDLFGGSCECNIHGEEKTIEAAISSRDDALSKCPDVCLQAGGSFMGLYTTGIPIVYR